MLRTFRKLLVGSLLLGSGLGCALGLSIGLWSAMDGQGVGVILARGSIALAAILVLSLLSALLLAHIINRSFENLRQAVGQLQRGRYELGAQSKGPAAFGALAEDLQELGLQLQKRQKEQEQDFHRKTRAHRDEALLRFAQGVVREVQKPLAGVIGFVELAGRQNDLPAQVQNYLKFIDQEARAGRESLDRILRYSRDEAHATEPLDINGLLRECSRGVSATEELPVRMEYNLGKDLPKIIANAGSLMQVFTTLFDNARDAISPAGGKITVSSNLDAEGQLLVMVQDDGRGIPKEDQAKVFSPYFTNKGNLKGAGLSLALADRIVAQHGGSMEFSSTPGGGSVFFVRLPTGQNA